VLTGITGNTITHWWASIATQDPKIFFCAQFKPCGKGKNNTNNSKEAIVLTALSSRKAVESRGLQIAGRLGDSPNITMKLKSEPNRRVTMV
jgi:hypothetical protein